MNETIGDIAEIDVAPLIRDSMTDELLPKMRDIAERIRNARESKRFVLLKFHNDADGIAGAFSLTSVLRCRTYQQNGAVYSVKDAFRDLHALGNETKPMAILLDFGMNKESEEGLRYLSAAGVEIIVIDHHKPVEMAQNMDASITPWEFREKTNEENPSRYVAGYLTAEIAVMCGLERATALGYARISCAGDKSDLLEPNEDDKKKALVLDYLAMNASFGNNLEFYRNVMNKKELFDSIHMQAEEKISEAVNALMEGAKAREAGGAKFFVFDTERVVSKGEFPNRSKVTTGLFEQLNDKETPLVVFGCGENVLIMRSNNKATEKGIDLAHIASEMKGIMPDFVISGGGHTRAAAIRIKKGYVKSVVNGIIERIENNEKIIN